MSYVIKNCELKLIELMKKFKLGYDALELSAFVEGLRRIGEVLEKKGIYTEEDLKNIKIKEKENRKEKRSVVNEFDDWFY